ncbi:MAG: hypothetical protein K0S80_4387 [Neobacillus sp.]|nr:hypothetical protein [Neobacillus sp.]
MKQSALVLLNLLARQVICQGDDWYTYGEELRKLALDHGVYPNGPLVMTIDVVKNEPGFKAYTLFLPINAAVKVTGDETCTFIPMLEIQRTLCMRHYESVALFYHSYQRLKESAEEYGFVLEEPFYHVCLEVNGDVFFDIHAPVKGVQKNGY